MKRIRQHVNPLSISQLGRKVGRLDLPRDRVAEVELGCGDGRFLFERAQVDRGGYYLGIEIRPELCDKINRSSVASVRAVCANLLVSEDMFGPASVDRFYVNFPDPLFKRAHRRRRWLTPKTARNLWGALRPGGVIFFQSDVFETSLDALYVLEQEPGLVNLAGEWSFQPENPFGARSKREVSCDEEGIRVWRLRFGRVPVRDQANQDADRQRRTQEGPAQPA